MGKDSFAAATEDSGRETPAKYLDDFDDVIAIEHREIGRLRGGETDQLKRNAERALAARPPEGAKGYAEKGVFDTVGLALSGGGIRSAAFCLGILQGLAARNIIAKLDYLSTVSGGGYAGTALSVNMAHNGGQFPFLGPKGEKVDTEAVKQFRYNANYLQFGNFWQMLINLAIYLRGLAANLLFVVPLLLVLAGITLWSNPDYSSLDRPDFFGFEHFPEWLASLGNFGLTFFTLALTIICYVLWSVAVRKDREAGLESKFVKIACILLCVVAFALVLELQPRIIKSLLSVSGTGSGQPDLWNFIKAVVTYFAPLSAAMSFASRYLGEALKGSESGNGWTAWAKKAIASAVVWLAALALPLLIWILYLMLAYWGIDVTGETLPPRSQPAFYDPSSGAIAILNWGNLPSSSVYLSIGVGMIVLSLFLSANTNSLHRLYRDRLSQAFSYWMDNKAAMVDDNIKLSQLLLRPYHLINTALNVQRSKEINKLGRNADFFLFSPLYVGSKGTGYGHTAEIEKDTFAPDLNVPTAMAVSGAAVSSNMGSVSIHPLSPTLALLNVRLGYWFKNPLALHPDPEKRPRDRLLAHFPFLAEMSHSLDETREMIYLTDGGHVENLGLYELLRRRCKVIIVADAEADRELNFGALVKAQRYARIDLGAKIEIKWSHIKSHSVEMQKGKGKCQPGPHCAIGKIEYDNGGEGILVYLKSSVAGDENDYVSDYNRRYRDFPHETTADQFFSEEQFEVYRALGFHIAKGVFDGSQLVQTLDGNLNSLGDRTSRAYGVRELRRRLALPTIGRKALPKPLAG